MNIYEINTTIKQLKDRADNGELDPEVLKDTLDSLEATRSEKLDGLAGWYEKNGSDIDYLTKKIKDFTEEKKRLTNLNDRIMTYITESIDEAGYKEMTTEHHKLRPRNYRASTIITDENELPEIYKHEETVVKIDKQAVYQALKNGVTVHGAELKPNRKTRII